MNTKFLTSCTSRTPLFRAQDDGLVASWYFTTLGEHNIINENVTYTFEVQIRFLIMPFDRKRREMIVNI